VREETIVNGLLKRVAGFLRWLLASEQLPDAPPRIQRGRGFTARLLKPDALPAPGDDRPHRPGDRGFLRVVLAGEELARREAPAGGAAPRGGFLGRVLAPQALPRGTAVRGDASRRGIVKWLLSSQELPRVERAPRRRGTGFVRWLFSRDDL
jgi:hypothetical protein